MLEKPPVYISAESIQKRVAELGKEITQTYKDKPLICVGILKGSVLFFADLIRNIDLPIKVDFLSASSYGDQTTSSGVVKINHDLTLPIENEHVLLIEDIVDTGTTMAQLMVTLKQRNPASLKLCSLLLKPSRLKTAVDISYLGFEVEDHFVIGYGLDVAEKFRNLPYIGKLDPVS